ncbi:cephalosporin C regulator [Fusarium sp. NRRL 25303]|nr:cephalosporin C regulator [Fusarium sp. NRRL 25303]
MEHNNQNQAQGPTTRAAVRSTRRPLSRASTASLNSLEQPAFPDASDMYNAQWMTAQHGQVHPNGQIHPNAHVHGHAQVKDMNTPQMSAEDIMMAQQLQATQDFSMDASMSAPMGHQMQYQQQKHAMQRHPLPAEQYNSHASFTEGDSQMMERDDNDENSFAGMIGAPKPASNRSSANNEIEMRALFKANEHRSLPDVASELHGNERGPNSERTRQVFAMLWIHGVCERGKGSVPRGRVYANYASRCATERITVLNPASFGKLVRVLFPGLKTRRLGVRGESKYHYVNFTLKEDQAEVREPSVQPTRALPEPPAFTQSFNTLPSQTTISLSQGALPSPQIGSTETNPAPVSQKSGFQSRSIYNQPQIANIAHLSSSTTKTQLELGFRPESDGPVDPEEPLILPNLEPYLPQGTDPDAAKSLFALYRAHCTSLVDCIRFCKEKTFFHLYGAFQGTLTMPVLKLFGNPALAPWIEECDFILYQRMMSIVSGLKLQVVPKYVLDIFRSISDRLVMHIRESFQGQPQHVIRAKEGPAALFVGLIDRALRVNLTAHAAANFLSSREQRNQMYIDWITTIRPRKIAECVPTRGMDDVVNLLLNEIRDLVDPTDVPWEVECLTIYGDVLSRKGRPSDSEVDGGAEASGEKGESYQLDRWVTFLNSLPTRFPYASASDIMLCVERIGTAVMRDLTMNQGKSFSSWWVTKTWIDELVCFMVEEGGFMKQKRSQTTWSTTPTPPQATKDTSRQPSRYSGGSDEFNLNNSSQNQGERAPFPPANKPNQNSMGMSGGDVHDDSGIGIRTPEEDFPMDKFGFTGTDNQEHALLEGAEFTVDEL